MSELNLALRKYGKNATTIVPEPGYQDLLTNLGGITPYERPDGYLVSRDTVYIVEHFEFDSSQTSRKGSTSRQELGRTKREFAAYPVDSGDAYTDALDIAPTMECYLENAERNMQGHYAKLSEYMERLKENGIIGDGSIVKCGFYIEDVTVLGNYTQDDNGLHPLLLTECKQFLDMFEDCPELDFCLCASSHRNPSCDIFSLFDLKGGISPQMQRQLHFVSKASIQAHRARQKDTTALVFRTFSTNTLGIKVSFP